MKLQSFLCYIFLFVYLLICVNSFSQSRTIQYCDSILKVSVEAIFIKKDYVRALEILEETRLIAEQNNWYEQLFLSLNNIGITHYIMFDYGEALNYYLQAYTVSLKHLDDQQTMIVLNNIAILYSKEKNYSKSEEYFHKAYDIAQKNDDLIKVGFYSINLGIVYNKLNQLELAEKYLNEALSYVSSIPDKYMGANVILLENYLLKGKYNLVINKSCELLQESEIENHPVLSSEMYFYMAKAYYHLGNLSEATYYAQKSLINNDDIDSKSQVYAFLSDLNYKTRNYDKSLLYKDSVLLMNDSLYRIQNGHLYESSKIKFEIQNYQHELSLKETQLKSERKFFYAVIGIILILLIFFIWWIRNRNIKQKQEKILEESKRKIIELELDNEKSENLLLEKQLKEKETKALLEQKQLKSEIELRNRQLSAKAIFLTNRDQMLEEWISHLSEISDSNNNKQLYAHIKTLERQLNSNKEWDTFLKHFEEVNQGLLSRLKQKHPELNANDIRFISYIYMNLSTKEISNLLNIRDDACRKRKQRILQKMELEGNADLIHYLYSI